MEFEFYDNEIRDNKLKYIIIGSTVALFILIIGIIVVGGSRGVELTHATYDMYDVSALETEKATCVAYQDTVVSTYAIYNEFLTDCELDDLGYTEGYFIDGVFVVHFEYTENTRLPKTFYDSYFTRNGKEIIKVVYANSNKENTFVYNLYTIELNRHEISSFNVIIG